LFVLKVPLLTPSYQQSQMQHMTRKKAISMCSSGNFVTQIFVNFSCLHHHHVTKFIRVHENRHKVSAVSDVEERSVTDPCPRFWIFFYRNGHVKILWLIDCCDLIKHHYPEQQLTLVIPEMI